MFPPFPGFFLPRVARFSRIGASPWFGLAGYLIGLLPWGGNFYAGAACYGWPWTVCGAYLFPECVARVPVSLGGLGVRLCSPKVAFATATVRNRSQPFATVRVRAVRLSTVASASGVVPKACQVESWRRSYIGVCRGGVSESDLCRRSYIGVCRGGVCESDLCRRNYIGVCRAGVCESDLCRRSYIGFCRGGVCESDLCRRSYIGVCRGGVRESDDLSRRSYIGVCRGGVSVSDLSFGEEVSVWGICVAAVILVFAEEVSVMWVICVPEECQVRASYKSVK